MVIGNKTRKKTVAAGRFCFGYHRSSSLFSIRLVPTLLSNQNNTALTAAGFIMPDGAVEVIKTDMMMHTSACQK